MNGHEMVKLELGGLCSEPFKKSDFIVMEVRALENVEVPLMLLSMSQWVVDVTSNGGLL